MFDFQLRKHEHFKANFFFQLLSLHLFIQTHLHLFTNIIYFIYIQIQITS